MTVQFIHAKTGALFTREHVKRIVWHDDNRFTMEYENTKNIESGVYSCESTHSNLFKVVSVF